MKKFIIITAIQAVVIGGAIYGWNYLFPAEVVAYEVAVPKPFDIERAIESYAPAVDPVLRSHIAATIQKYSDERGLDPALVTAVAARESGFAPMRKNGEDCGVMQINTRYQATRLVRHGITSTTLYHIDNNVMLGTEILKENMDRYGNVKQALQAYVGQSHKSYVQDVLAIYGTMKMEG